jgi:4-amino-4-deoxy-L-arabinose transferase-like glycosyltransferase
LDEQSVKEPSLNAQTAKRGPLFWVILGAVGIRVVYWLMYSGSLPLAEAPIGDAEVYREAASRMAEGDWLDPSYSYRPFLYPLWLGGVFTLLGPTLWAVYVLQSALGIGTIVLAHHLGERLFGPAVGLGAAILLVLHGPMVWAESKLLDTSLTVFLHLASVTALVRARRAVGWAGSGALLGLAGVSRPPLLLFLALALGWIWRRGYRPALWVATGALLALLPFCCWNLAASGSFTPWSRNGGATFYAGNHAGATGEYTPAPGFSGEARLQEQEEAALKRPALKAAWGWIRENPLNALALWGLKLYRFAMADEAPLEYDFDHESGEVPLLQALAIPFSLLLVFGLWGLALRREPGTGLLGLALLVHAGVAAAFFVATRYRLPAAPLLSILAAAGALALWERFRSGRRRAALAQLILASAVTTALAFNPLPGANERWATAVFNLGYAHERLGEVSQAEAHYREVLALRPEMTEAWLHLGNLAAASGDALEAESCYRRILERRPRDVRALANLGLLRLRASPPDPREAVRYFRLAVQIAPYQPELFLKLGNAERAAGNLPAAVQAFEAALALAPCHAGAWNNLGTALWAAAERPRSPEWGLLARAAEALGHALACGSPFALRNLEALERRFAIRQ